MIETWWNSLGIAWFDLVSISGSETRAWIIAVVLFGIVPVMIAKLWMMRYRRLRAGDPRAIAPGLFLQYLPLNRTEAKAWGIALITVIVLFILLTALASL